MASIEVQEQKAVWLDHDDLSESMHAALTYTGLHIWVCVLGGGCGGRWGWGMLGKGLAYHVRNSVHDYRPQNPLGFWV